FAPPRPIPTRPPRTPTLFPYTTLFRSVHRQPASPPTEVRRLGQRIDRVGQRNVGQRGRVRRGHRAHRATGAECHRHPLPRPHGQDRKSTRLNSSHVSISYAVFCLKKTT